MLKKIENLPPSVLGLKAEGKLTRADYENTFVPLLEEAYRKGRKVRFLYQLGPEFVGITPGAAMDDARLGLKYIRTFEMCAIVSDVDWITNALWIFGLISPFPTRAFKNREFDEAVQWLANGTVSEQKTG